MNKAKLKQQLTELIEEEKFAKVFELIQSYKELFEDYQAYRNDFLLNAPNWTGSQRHAFKERLRVFVSSCLQDNSYTVPKETNQPNDRRRATPFPWGWVLAIIVLGGSSVSIFNNNKFGCDNTTNVHNQLPPDKKVEKENKKDKPEEEKDKPNVEVDKKNNPEEKKNPPEVRNEEETLGISSYAKSNKAVRRGDRVQIKASGSMSVGKFVGNSTPAGKESGVMGMSLEAYSLVKQFNHAALLYRLSPDDGWELAKDADFEAATDGALEFLVNDNNTSDNIGEYRVRITITRK